MESKTSLFLKKYLNLTIGVSIFVGMFIWSTIKTNTIEQSIEENEEQVVGEVYDFYSNARNKRYYYHYNYRNKKYKNNESIIGFGEEECVGKRYVVKLSSKNPEYSKIQLDEEVTDSTQTKNTGL